MEGMSKREKFKDFLEDLWYYKEIIILIVVVLFFVVGAVFLIYNVEKNSSKIKSYETGIDAVKYLYNFGSLEELDANMDKLRKITTPEVYTQLTVDNTSRALNVYLKFKNNPSIVEIDEFTDTYVAYHLTTATIASSRKFIFMYHRNEDGIIDRVREVEAIDFVNN